MERILTSSKGIDEVINSKVYVTFHFVSYLTSINDERMHESNGTNFDVFEGNWNYRFAKKRFRALSGYTAGSIARQRRFYYIRAHFAYVLTEYERCLPFTHVTSPLLHERDNLNYKFTTSPLLPSLAVYIHHGNNQLSEKMKLPLML